MVKRMKIALFFDKNLEYTTGIYFEMALKRQGFDVKHFWLREAKDIKPKYDLYLRIDHGYYDEDIPDYLRPKVFYAIDTHLEGPFRCILNISRKYDLVFCAHYDGYLKLKEEGINVHWLPLACDPQVHKRLEVDKLYDIGFVGNDGGTPRKFYLQELREKFTNSFIGNAPYLKMGQIYSQSKIGFNYSIFNELNMRFFEIMSSGTMLLTNPIKECNIEELSFIDGEHLKVYHNPKELLALIDYYLTHDKERESIAQKGYQLVISRHTYDHRFKEMLESIHKRVL